MEIGAYAYMLYSARERVTASTEYKRKDVNPFFLVPCRAVPTRFTRTLYHSTQLFPTLRFCRFPLFCSSSLFLPIVFCFSSVSYSNPMVRGAGLHTSLGRKIENRLTLSRLSLSLLMDVYTGPAYSSRYTIIHRRGISKKRKVEKPRAMMRSRMHHPSIRLCPVQVWKGDRWKEAGELYKGMREDEE